MPTDSYKFDDRYDNWQDHMQKPWSKLFYRIQRANIQLHLPQSDQPLRILDIGGGDGLDALYYASMGQHVTIIDYATKMLEQAQRSAEQAGLSEYITTQQLDATRLHEFIPENPFDMVLCHNVIQYIDDVPALLIAIKPLLKPEGFLSLISINRFSYIYRMAILDHDFTGALHQLDQRVVYNSLFDVDNRLFTVEEARDLLMQQGYAVQRIYGLRCINDYVKDNEVKHNPETFEQLAQLELALSPRHPFYLVARSFQLIAQVEAG